jgi:hypothetical protein
MTMKDFNKERVLGALGLAIKPRTTAVVLGATGMFALGVLVGASVALFMAPRAGRELRRELRQRLARERSIDEERIS